MSQLTVNYLIISYYFPPIKSVASIRLFNISQQFVKKGFGVNVLSTSNREKLPQDFEAVSEKVNMYTALTLDYRTFSRGNAGNMHFDEAGKEPLVNSFLIKLIKNLPTSILFGEGGLSYIFSGILKGRKAIRNGDVTHMFSSYRPYANHIIAFMLKAMHGHLHWTADFRDVLYDEQKRHAKWPKLQYRINRVIMRKADLLTTVSEGCATQFAHVDIPVHVMTNGCNPTSDTYRLAEKFTITYTGSLIAELRDPRPLFAVVRKLYDAALLDETKFRVRYAGKDSGLWVKWLREYELMSVAKVYPVISHEHAIEFQRSSHINLLLTSSSSAVTGALTGKLFEYLGARRPIFAIVNGSKDEELDFYIRNYNNGIVVSTTEPKVTLESALMELYTAYSRQEFDHFRFEAPELGHITWSKVVDRYLKATGHSIDQGAIIPHT